MASINKKKLADSVIEEIKRRNSITQEDLEKVLARDGLTLEALKKEIEKKILRGRVVQWAVKVEPNVGEKELRACNGGPILINLVINIIRELGRCGPRLVEKIYPGQALIQGIADFYLNAVGRQSRLPFRGQRFASVSGHKDQLIVAIQKRAIRLRAGIGVFGKT
jgi:predicted RNA-binding protein YlqC (UPF0109 family)